MYSKKPYTFFYFSIWLWLSKSYTLKPNDIFISVYISECHFKRVYLQMWNLQYFWNEKQNWNKWKNQKLEEKSLRNSSHQ